MSAPITPSEVAGLKAKVLPEGVVEEWNKIIAEKWTGTRAEVLQSEITQRLCARLSASSAQVFEKGWLDIEPLFERVGWRVTYDKPGFNETYPASFVFTIRSRR